MAPGLARNLKVLHFVMVLITIDFTRLKLTEISRIKISRRCIQVEQYFE